MSTRARTRAAAAAAAAASASLPTSSHVPTSPVPNLKSSPAKSKRKSNTKDTTSLKQQQEQFQSASAAADPSAEKENIKTASSTPTRSSSSTKKQSQPKSKATPKVNVVYCICSRGDDGSPMIRCTECKVWYHFICVDLSEREAEEINVYICSPCTQSTGRKTAMVWEGKDALEDCGSEEETIQLTTKPTGATNIVTRTAKSNTTPATTPAKLEPKKPSVIVSLPPPLPRLQTPSDESDDAGSADNYVAEAEETRGSSKTKGKRRLRRISSSDSSFSSEAEETPATSSTRTSKRNRPPTKLRKLSSPRSQTPISPALASATTPTTSTSNKSLSRLKRKSSIAEKETSTPVPKRKRSDAGGAGAAGDPVRNYCLGKFEEVFKEVFLRYPYIRLITVFAAGESGETRDAKLEEDRAQTSGSEAIVMKKLEELSDEEKESLIEDSKRFAAELEQCVFDIYSEGGIAGAKYKDRFRTLQFNLSKPDRIVIHQRIIKRTITLKEISLMSSTDLADEETKQHIKIAEKESLEQTILQKPIVPRAKITHKGLQDIEDVHGDLARAREVERQREREQEEEERRERERRERLRAVEKQQQQQRQRTQSLSVPPESPVVPSHSPITADQQQTWGAPPPVPAHVLQQQQQQQSAAGSSDDILTSSIRPLFAPTISSAVMATAPELELNLADLINIDEDGTEQDTNNASATVTGIVEGAGVPGGPESSGETNSTTTAMDIDITSPSSGAPAPHPLEQPIEHDGSVSDKPPGVHHTMSALTLSPTSPTTPSSSSIVSPFSATRPRGLSFDLNSLWQSAPKDENDISRTPESPSVQQHQDQGSPSVLLDTDKSTTARVRGSGGESSVNDPPSGSNLPGIGGEPGVGGVRDLMEPEPMEVANDDDFDMFLAEEKYDVVDRSGSRGTTAGNSIGTIMSTTVPSKTETESHIPQDPEAAFEAIQQCWTGKIHMPLDAAAPQSMTVSAKQVGGRSLGHQSLWWKTLFPLEELRIDGRVNTKSSEEFLTQTRLNQHKELLAVAFSPALEEMKADFVGLIDYLKERDRHGLIFPWGIRPKDTCPGREMYLVPLRAKEPLPEYIELLDELKIPKTREMDLLMGIWILHRGKLNHPPPQPAPISTGTPTTAALPTPATNTVPPIPNIPPLPLHLASAKSQSPSIPTPSQNPPVLTPTSVPSAPPQSTSGLPPQINQAALAAEVASLTPDQVQNLLRTLTASNLPFPINLPAPGGSGSPAVQPPLVPGQSTHGSHPPPQPPSHPWPGYLIPGGPPPSQPPGSYPPPPPPPPPGSIYGHPPPLPHSHSYPPPPSPHGPPDHDRRDSYDSPHSHYGGGRSGDRERGARSGWRGSSGGNRNQRGRGKHRGGGGGNAAPQPVDSGWPRRSKNDDGNSSPGRRWG